MNTFGKYKIFDNAFLQNKLIFLMKSFKSNKFTLIVFE